MEHKLKAFINAFKEGQFIPYCKDQILSGGQGIIYAALLLFYAYKNKSTPGWARNIIIGALGYFLSPFDAIPDMTPFFGMTDDMSLLSFALVTIACYIDDGVRSNARHKITTLTSKLNEEQLAKIDRIL